MAFFCARRLCWWALPTLWPCSVAFPPLASMLLMFLIILLLVCAYCFFMSAIILPTLFIMLFFLLSITVLLVGLFLFLMFLPILLSLFIMSSIIGFTLSFFTTFTLRTKSLPFSREKLRGSRIGIGALGTLLLRGVLRYDVHTESLLCLSSRQGVLAHCSGNTILPLYYSIHPLEKQVERRYA